MSGARLIFERQLVHLVALALLVGGLYLASSIEGFATGEFLGLATVTWVWINIANAVAHQLFVWLCWRLELHAGLITRWFGKAAFRLYAVVFTILIVARLLVTVLAYSNRGTLPINATLAVILGVLCTLPAAYLGYSIKRYFTFRRALGIDHFDRAFRSAPLVRKGIFRWSRNAMYTYGFLLLWAPALGFRSVAAMSVAAFSHIYIWVHYACTEKPDMKRIYEVR